LPSENLKQYFSTNGGNFCTMLSFLVNTSMKRLIRYAITAIFTVFFVAYIISCNTSRGTAVHLDVNKAPFESLSEYNFFTGELNQLKPNLLVLPYDLNSSLFTDYAFKARFVYVPEGKTIPYDTTEVLKLPVGACLIKNFYYPADFNKPEGKRRIMETRLLVHRDAGWEALDYIWNDEQTAAILDNAGDIKKVSWIHYDGTKREADYVIPNKNQCKGCHWFDGNIRPIGPKVRNLNKVYAYADGKENQLVRWTKAGILSGAPALGDCPKNANWQDSVNYDLNARARAYLDINCGHCHNEKGPAYTSGLWTNWENNDQEHLGICKSPVAAGKATGNRLYDETPGKPEESIMVYRMESTDPGIRMPEVGRQLVHTEGVELISRWIRAMEAKPCK
jgi:uncharacterized repeat protein (TIGR03806 family)